MSVNGVNKNQLIRRTIQTLAVSAPKYGNEIGGCVTFENSKCTKCSYTLSCILPFPCIFILKNIYKMIHPVYYLEHAYSALIGTVRTEDSVHRIVYKLVLY